MSTSFKKLIIWIFYILGGILVLGGISIPLGIIIAACAYYLKRSWGIDID